MFGASKGKNETVDRTNNMTGFNLNGSTLNRKNTDSRSTSSNFSMRNNLQISSNNLMPILVHLKQENQHFKSQKDTICAQIQALDGLTNKILNQNQSLRMHYHQRTTDLQQLVKTFTLNYNQELSQTRHLVHSFKEHNCITVKQIQKITMEGESLSQQVQRINQKYKETTMINLKLQQNLTSRRAKNKLIQKNIAKLKSKLESSKNDQLQKQVCDLQIQNNILKKKNIKTLHFIKNQQNTISYEKPEIKNNAIQAIKSAKALKQEVQKIKDDYQKFIYQKQELQEKLRNAESQYLIKYTNSQRKTLQLKNKTERMQQMEKKFAQIRKNIENLIKQKQIKQVQKNELLKQLQQKKKLQSNMQINHQSKMKQMRQQNLQKINQIKASLSKSQDSYAELKNKQLNPEKRQSEYHIASLKQQLRIIQQDALQIQKKVNSTNNPVKQIMKMQMQLSKPLLSRR